MKKILILLMMFSFFGLYAQQDEEQHCGLQIAYDLLKKDGNLETYKESHRNAIKDFQMHKDEIMNRSLNTVYQVPVVVHILWDDANGLNVTDEQVEIMIQNLNKDYARLNDDADVTRPEFLSVASSVDIQFCLAKTDPNGQGTNGIIRKQTNHGWFNPGNGGNAEDMKYTEQGGDDAWDTHLYLNVWIGDLISGAGGGAVIMGYSTLDGSHGQPNDGFIMDCSAVASGQLDRTPTHEIGHYFGLKHPWGENDNNPSCNEDDGFNDTPNTNDKHLGMGCDGDPHNCGSKDQLENFMGYSNCTNMFTAEQAAYMKNTLETTRASLLNDKCNSPILTADFTPNTPTITIDAGETIIFSDLSSGPVGVSSWNWVFNGGTPMTANTGGSKTITYDTPGTFSVSLTVGDDNGDTDAKTVNALVEVIDVLNANFSSNLTYVPIGEQITFTDMTSGPNAVQSWNWNLGDGTVANTQNTTHSYSSEGLYTVTLTVNDGTENDTETKVDYIQVYDPNSLNIVDFTGNPTTINVGENVHFELELNQSDNLVDSIRWIVPGTEQGSIFKQNSYPFTIAYTEGGTFDVEVRVYRDNANDGDTLIKAGYITVISPEVLPEVNFSANHTNIPVGSNVDFINLTSNIENVDTFEWTIETDAGIITSTEEAPSAITYNAIGDYTVSLKTYSSYGNDSITKTNYIHVFDPNNVGNIHANFEATTVRLITVGESVRFEDFSTGDIENWTYIFDRGAGDADLEFSTQQNPEHIFANAGYYTVTLIASNSSHKDTIVKNNYVIVTTTTWPGGGNAYCDTISPLKNYESANTFKKITGNPEWGVFPGHSALLEEYGSSTPKTIKQYAQKYETYQPDYISGVLIPVSKAFSGDAEGEIRVRIWNSDVNGYPKDLISGGTSSNKVKINTFEEQIFNYIKLDDPVEVDSVFFVGFRLDYKTNTSPQDTFATYMVNRVEPSENSLYLSKNSNSGPWKTPSTYFEPNIYAALDIRLISCIVSVKEIEDIENELTLYPNPNNGEAYVDFGSIHIEKIDVEFFDMLGKKTSGEFEQMDNNSKLKLNFSNNENGIYFIRFNVNGYQLTKKVLLQK